MITANELRGLIDKSINEFNKTGHKGTNPERTLSLLSALKDILESMNINRQADRNAALDLIQMLRVCNRIDDYWAQVIFGMVFLSMHEIDTFKMFREKILDAVEMVWEHEIAEARKS